MWNIAVKWINEVGRWGAAVAGVRGEGWFCFDSAKVGFCRGRGAVAETLHDEEPKVGARALQGLGRGEKGRGGAERNAVAFDRNGAARRREGTQKRPDRGERVGPEGIQ